MGGEITKALNQMADDAAAAKRYRKALEEIVGYEVTSDQHAYLDALALQDKAREALGMRQEGQRHA